MRLYISPSNQPANKYAAGNTTEKKEMEALAKLLQKELEPYDMETVMATLSLHYSKRDEEAKAKGCTLYMALHSDAGTKTAVGATAFSTPQTAALAEEVIKELNAICPYPENRADQTKDGVVAGFGEIWGPKAKGIPPILVEVNFHSNPTTALWIINNKQVIAAAITRALVRTYKLSKKVTPGVPATKPEGPKTTTTAASFKPYTVIINTAFLNYRKGPGVNYQVAGVVKFREKYTIVGEKNGWGQLKSGAGWINLKYTKRG